MKWLIRFTFFLYVISPVHSQEDPYLLKSFKEHKGGAGAVAFSPSGKYLASGGEDKKLYVYDLESYSVLYEHKDNYYPVKDIVFFGEEHLFVTAGNDIKFVTLENKAQGLYEGNSTHVQSLAFAPERNKITAGSYDNRIKVWDVDSREIDLVLEGHKKNTLAVVFSPDEKYIISGSLDKSIKIWNAKDGTMMNSLEKHSENIYDLAFHPDPAYFASASGDKTIRLWDIETGTVVKTYSGHDAEIIDIEFSPDGYFIYSAGTNGVIVIWETGTGKKLYSYVLHEGYVNSIEVSKDGRYLASAGKDSKVYLWESAKNIAVDTYFGEELKEALTGNKYSGSRKKGESKEEYAERQHKALEEKENIISGFYDKYKAQLNYKNLP